MKILASLVKGLAVPLMLSPYLIAFWISTEGMPPSNNAYPRAIVACLGVLIIVTAGTESWKVLRPGRGVDRRSDSAHPSSRSTAAEVWRNWRYTTFTICGLLGFTLLLWSVNTYLATAIFIPGLVLALGYRKWWGLVAWTFGGELMIVLFVQILQLQLPGTQ